MRSKQVPKFEKIITQSVLVKVREGVPCGNLLDSLIKSKSHLRDSVVKDAKTRYLKTN